MTAPQTTQGVGAELQAELMVREVLLRGLAALRRDELRQRELFRRVDRQLDYSSAEDVEDDWVHYFTHELADLGQENAVSVNVGYPHDATMLPYISIIDESTSENPDGAMCADVGQVAYELQGTVSDDETDWAGYTKIRHERLNTDHTTNVQVGVWATSAEQALLLAGVVHHILVRDRGRLESGSVYEVMTSEGGMQPPKEFLEMGIRYIPILSVRMSWHRRQTRRVRVANRARLTASYSTS